MNNINCGFATTFHSIMSQEKVDKGDTEMNVHGGEIEDAELDPEKERSLDPVGRTRRVNTQDREDFEAEEMSQARRSLGGYLARVSTVINQVKIGIEMQKEKIAREMRFKFQLEEKEVDLLALEDYDNASNEDNSVVKNDECDPRFFLEPQPPKQERAADWVANCRQETKPLNLKAVKFAPQLGTNSIQAVLLRVTTLQEMQPVKFSGSAADFPFFRRRIVDNLEDGLLSNAQKMEFLPKFVTGVAYDVVARSAACSYEDIVANLEDR